MVRASVRVVIGCTPLGRWPARAAGRAWLRRSRAGHGRPLRRLVVALLQRLLAELLAVVAEEAELAVDHRLDADRAAPKDSQVAQRVHRVVVPELRAGEPVLEVQ